MGQVARLRADEAGEVRKRLRIAALALVQGGPDSVRLDDDAGARKIDPWLRGYDLQVDRAFFGPGFWDDFDGRADHPRREWRSALAAIARDQFECAAEAAPRSDMRRIRAQAVARNILDATLHAYLKEIADAG